jgi:LacI family transcriptional regulator
MRDIGQTLGLAQSTVSRALRNDPRISHEVRARVCAKAKELGYRPNPFVSAFTSQVRTHRRSPIRPTIAFLDCFAAPMIGYFEVYAKGARERATSLGFRTEMLCLRDLDGSFPAFNRVMRARGIVGLLVLPVPEETDLTGIDYRHLAAATVDPSLRKPDLHRATPDYFQGMELTLNTLASRGCHRVLFCSFPDEVSRIGHRWLGSYYRWQSATGERVLPYVDHDWTVRSFIAHLRREKPDVVVSNSRHFYGYLIEAGIRVPDEVGFASLSLAREDSEMAGINQNGELVAAAAIDLIVSQIYRNEFGLPEHPKSVSIRGQWTDGPTVPALAGTRPVPA